MTQPDEISKVAQKCWKASGSCPTPAACKAHETCLESATPAEARGEVTDAPLGIDTANHAGVRVRGYTVEQYATLARQLAEANEWVKKWKALSESASKAAEVIQRSDARNRSRAEQVEAQLAQATARLAAVEGLLREALDDQRDGGNMRTDIRARIDAALQPKEVEQ